MGEGRYVGPRRPACRPGTHGVFDVARRSTLVLRVAHRYRYSEQPATRPDGPASVAARRSRHGALVVVHHLFASGGRDHRADGVHVQRRLTCSRSGAAARLSPVWAILGWIVPVVNIWFPYWVLRDCFPPHETNKRDLVLRWWLLQIFSFLIVMAVVIGRWVNPLVGALFIVVDAVYAVVHARSGSQAIARMCKWHEALTEALFAPDAGQVRSGSGTRPLRHTRVWSTPRSRWSVCRLPARRQGRPPRSTPPLPFATWSRP